MGCLVCRSSTGRSAFDLALGQETPIEPAGRPFLYSGVGLSPDDLASVSVQGGGEVDFPLGFHSLSSVPMRAPEGRRPLAIQTSAMVWNARGESFTLRKVDLWGRFDRRLSTRSSRLLSADRL